VSDFGKEIAAAYATTGASIEVGKGVFDGKVVTEADVRDPAKATEGGTDALGDFLGSRQGKALQREVVRGVFGLLRKRL
jgi:hypothetical protein